jgi:transcriptional regulator with XRE-family HTH domain
MLDSKEMARRIKMAMDEAKPPITGADLAEACGVTPQAVSGWRSTGRLGKRHLMTIARLTGRPVEYFVSESVHLVTKNGNHQPWLVERIVEPEQFLIVFRTWQDARHTDRQSMVAVAKTARKSHGTRRRRGAS